MTRSPLWPLFLVVFALSLGALADDTPVDIPDEALRALLAEELGKDADDEITRDDLASLTSLSYTWPVVGERVDIADLTGLEFAVNLTYLYLRGNDIVDLGALARLDKLESLDLDGNRIADLSPLAGLPALRVLFAGRNPIEDITPLAALPRLENLELANTRIERPLLGRAPLRKLVLRGARVSDLSVLEGLAELRELDLGENPLIDLTPLQRLPGLRELWLDGCGITDLSGLTGLRAVTNLVIAHNSITDLSPLSGLSTLARLDVSSNAVTDLSPLQALSGLTALNAGHNEIKRLTPLAGQVGLTSLALNDNRIEDLSPIAGLTALWWLNLANNRIRHILPLAGLSDIEDLMLGGNRIAVLPPLSKLASLRRLSLWRNELTDVSGVEGLAQLRTLSITDNQVRDLTPLAGLDSLYELRASRNLISDLSPLAGLSGLRSLSVAENDISDLSPLADGPDLGRLDLSGNRIRDLWPLKGLSNVINLAVSDNDVADLSPLRDGPDIWNLSVARNRLVDIEPLRGAMQLRFLRLDDNSVADLSPVSEMPRLWGFSADGNAIADLSAVSINGAFGMHGEPIEGYASIARNPLDEASVDVHVSRLLADDVQVTVRVHHAPLLASSSVRQGFVRVVNDASDDARILMSGSDDNRRWAGELELLVPGDGAVQFTSADFYNGNPAKRMPRTLSHYTAAGDLGLEIRSPTYAVSVLAYVRGANGHLAALSGLVAPEDSSDDSEFRVRTFVPAGSESGIGLLRLTSATGRPTNIEVVGVDDTGRAPGTTVRLRLEGTRTLSAADLEAGLGLDGSLGDGEGMWNLRLTSDNPLHVMNLLESADGGRLTNLYSTPVRAAPHDAGTRHYVPLFAAGGAVLRILNLATETATVDIRAMDDAGTWHGLATLSIGAGEAVNLDRADLRDGAEGFGGAVDAGSGHWRLVVDSGQDLEVLAFAEALDGFLEATSLATSGRRHALAYFNPGSNRMRQSILRLVNWGDIDADVEIQAVDDAGSSRRVSFVVGSGAVVTLSATELERGGPGLSGALGDGTGKWRLRINSNRPLDAMSLMVTPAGLGNLTDDPDAREAPAYR